MIVGVDPGYDRLGVAVFNDGQLVYSACFTSSKQLDLPGRIAAVAAQFEAVLTTYPVTEVAVEELYFSKNQATALKVAEARGVIAYLAIKRGAQVYHYSPQAIKLAVAGYGQADKAQVTAMVKKLVPFKQLPQHDDEYDAVAVALTHLASRRQ